MKILVPGILAPAHAKRKAYFGAALAVSEDTILVGAPGDEIPGAAYVFVRASGAKLNIWTQQAKLAPATSSKHDEFGRSVALYGNWALVGGAGRVTLFHRQGGSWSRRKTIRGTDFDASDDFGWDVALNDEHLVVSTHRDRVFFFSRDGAVVTHERTVTSKSSGNLSLDGDRLLTTSSRSDGLVFRRGKSKWFKEGTLNLKQRNLDYRGSLSGTRALVVDEFQKLLHRFFSAKGEWKRGGDALESRAWLGVEMAGSWVLGPQMELWNDFHVASLYRYRNSKYEKVALIRSLWAWNDQRTRLFGTAAALSDRYAVLGASSAGFGQTTEGLAYVARLDELGSAKKSDSDASVGGAELVGFGDKLEAAAHALKLRILASNPPRTGLPPGLRVVAWRRHEAKRALIERLTAMSSKGISKSKSAGALLRNPSEIVVLTPDREEAALEFVREHALELARIRLAPAVLFLKAGEAAHRSLG